MASASLRSGVSRMKSASCVCMGWLEIRVEAAGIENSGGIESRFQLAVQMQRDRLQRRKGGDRLARRAKQRCVALRILRRFANGARLALRFQPAQAAAPFDELPARKLERRSDRRHGDPPERL